MVYDVPEYTWVTLARSARSDNVSHKAGRKCALVKGGNVEVIGTDPKMGTLVRYCLPNGARAAGALCPNGALVFLSPKTVAAWLGKGVVLKQVADEEAERSEVVKRLLAG